MTGGAAPSWIWGASSSPAGGGSPALALAPNLILEAPEL